MLKEAWLIAVPQLHEPVVTERSAAAAVSAVYRLAVPRLRVGTLDALVTLSDSVARDDSALEQLAERIHKQHREAAAAEDAAASSQQRDTADELQQQQQQQLSMLCVDFDATIGSFRWNEAKFPVGDNQPLPAAVKAIVHSAGTLEAEFKSRSAEYASVRQALSSVERQLTGNLASRNLADIVSAEHALESEHLVTQYVVVNAFNAREFLNQYESLSQYVVPRSATEIAADNEFKLYAVVVFKKGVDEFRRAARERRYNVRDFKYRPEQAGANETRREELQRRAGRLRRELLEWCAVAYAEAVEASMHVKVVRLFVESVLRYGLPVAFEAAVVAPTPRYEARVRQALNEEYAGVSPSSAGGGGGGGYGGGGGDGGDASELGGGVAALAGVGGEFYPYVSLTLTVHV